jgi:hypothetical protein
VSAIALAQLLNPRWTAKLVRLVSASGSEEDLAVTSVVSSTISTAPSAAPSAGGGVVWETEKFGGDQDRLEYHARKMASKDSRPAAQMSVVGSAVPPGSVLHLTLNRTPADSDSRS